MTRIEFYRTEEGWKGFKAQGHTGYARRGEDVVCAAMSVLTHTAVLGLKKVLGVDCLVKADETQGLLVCLLPDRLSGEEYKQAQLILEVLYAGVTATVEEYGNYVRVKEVPYREDEFAIFRLKKRRRKY